MNESGGDFQQGAPCTSQPVTFNNHLNTRGCLTGLRKQVTEKADQSNFDSGVVLISQLIDRAMDW